MSYKHLNKQKVVSVPVWQQFHPSSGQYPYSDTHIYYTHLLIISIKISANKNIICKKQSLVTIKNNYHHAMNPTHDHMNKITAKSHTKLQFNLTIHKPPKKLKTNQGFESLTLKVTGDMRD